MRARAITILQCSFVRDDQPHHHGQPYRLGDQRQMRALLHNVAKVVPVQNLWGNPDCGLKTRGWRETEAALRRMVHAAHDVRERLLEEVALA